MQLLKLVIFNVSIQLCIVHDIRIVLVRDGAIIPSVRMLGGYHTFAYDASMVRGRAIIIHMVSG
jgi:hypothetical protein